MRKIIGVSFILFLGILLYGCTGFIENSLDSSDKAALDIATKQDTGSGSLELLTQTITTKDNEIEFVTDGIDEEKVTFIYVANQKVFEQKIENGVTYKLDITNIENAHLTDYKPKVQLLQTMDDTEDGEIVTFKQVRYKVKKG